MENKKHSNIIALSTENAMTFEECLENLKFTRDFDLYLNMLNLLKDRYLIVLCTKEISGPNISAAAVEKIRCMGFSNYPADFHTMYLGIANKSSILCDSLSPKSETVHYEGMIESTSLFALSSKSSAVIEINGEDYSINSRGLNFAVYDQEKSEIVEVSCYDAFAESPTFYHRNFHFSNQYIDSHIFMPKKYMDSVTLPMKRSYFSNRKLDAKEVKNGIILPNKRIGDKTYGGVCDEYFNFIAGHHVFDAGSELEYPTSRHIVDSYTVPSENINYFDETVVYGGTMTDHPGHLIVESFADRIWWFVKNADSNLKIAVTTAMDNTLGSSEYAYFVKQHLNAFGISDDQVVFVKKPMKFKKIVIPDQSAIPIRICWPYEFTSEYVQVYQHITRQLSPATYKKIYLTKRLTAKKNIIGEDYFINFFKERGFKIIHPEEYTIKEQAALMYGAEEVVTVEGTNAHFAIFCKPSVKLTILTRMFTGWAEPQQLVNEAVGIKELFLVNTSGNFIINRRSTDGYNIFLDGIYNFASGLSLMCVTNEFKKYVKYVFGEELDITPEESLKSVLYEYLAYFPKHYSDAMHFSQIRDLKISDVLKNMSEVFLGEEFIITYQYSLDASIMSVLQRKKVVLFGAGAVGQTYWKRIRDAGLPLVSWVASVPVEGLPVNTLENLDRLEYDVILIAVKEKDMAEEIREILIERGVSREKILWQPPIRLKGENT